MASKKPPVPLPRKKLLLKQQPNIQVEDTQPNDQKRQETLDGGYVEGGSISQSKEKIKLFENKQLDTFDVKEIEEANSKIADIFNKKEDGGYQLEKENNSLISIENKEYTNNYHKLSDINNLDKYSSDSSYFLLGNENFNLESLDHFTNIEDGDKQIDLPGIDSSYEGYCAGNHNEERLCSQIGEEPIYSNITCDLIDFKNDCNNINMHQTSADDIQHNSDSQGILKQQRPLIYSSFSNDDNSEHKDFEVSHHQINKEKGIITEIIVTEENYINILKQTIEDYQLYLCKHVPVSCQSDLNNIFENVCFIYKKTLTFLNNLKQSSQDINGLISVFINSIEIFDCYVEYCKNGIKNNDLLGKIPQFVKQREEELQDRLGLSNRLSRPLHRLSQYNLILGYIRTQMEASESLSKNIESAKNIIENALRKCNDIIAIGLIKNCALDLSKQGSFIMRAAFNIISPRRFPSMVFLFDNIIVFTERTKNEDEFHYIDSIKMNHLNIRFSNDDTTTFSVTDFRRLKKFNDGYSTYVLEAEKEKLRNEWVQILEKKLWEQLNQAKESQSKLTNCDKKKIQKSTSPWSNLSIWKRKQRGSAHSVFYTDDDEDEEQN